MVQLQNQIQAKYMVENMLIVTHVRPIETPRTSISAEVVTHLFSNEKVGQHLWVWHVDKGRGAFSLKNSSQSLQMSLYQCHSGLVL